MGELLKKKLTQNRKRRTRRLLSLLVGFLVFSIIIMYTIYNNQERNKELIKMENQIKMKDSIIKENDSVLKVSQQKTIMLLDSIAGVVKKRNQLEKEFYYQEKANKLLRSSKTILAKRESWRGNSNGVTFEDVDVLLYGDSSVTVRMKASILGTGSRKGTILIEFLDNRGKEVYSNLQTVTLTGTSPFSSKKRATDFINREFKVTSRLYLTIDRIVITAK